MQASYERLKSGELRGPVPARGPCGEDGSHCRIGFHGTRERQTGPCIPLTVVRCHEHGLTFTVYPPGFVPYGRAAVVPVDLEGRTVSAERSRADGGGLVGTHWQAAVDAAQCQIWPESGGVVGCRRTQGRWLRLTAALFGLDDLPRRREQLSEVVDVPALQIHEVAATLEHDHSWRTLAQSLLRLLDRALSSAPPHALLTAGHVAGLWGRPSRWDPGGCVLRVCAV